MYRRLGRTHGRSGQVRKISPPPGFDPQTVQPIATRYTDWATRPTRITRNLSIKHRIFKIKLRGNYTYHCSFKGLNVSEKWKDVAPGRPYLHEHSIFCSSFSKECIMAWITVLGAMLAFCNQLFIFTTQLHLTFFFVYGSVHHNIFYEITNRCSYMHSILFLWFRAS